MTRTPPTQKQLAAVDLTEAQGQHVASIWRAHADGQISGEDAQARVEAYLARLVPPAPKKPRSARLAPSRYYARANEALYADREMTPTARRFVLLLVRHARGRDRVTGYVAQWADELAVTPRTIQNAQARAESRGFIRIDRVRNGSENEANIYVLLELATLPKQHKRARVADKAARESSRRAGAARRSRDSAHDEALLAVDDSFLNRSRDSRVFPRPPGENIFTPQGRDKSPSEISLQPIPLTPFPPGCSDERGGAPLVAAHGHSPAPPADSGAPSAAACCQAERAANFAPEPARSEIAAAPPEPP